MKDFNTLGGKELAEIINKRETEVIMVSQDISNTVQNKIDVWLKFSIPTITKEDFNRIIASTVLNGDDENNKWNTFILLVFNSGANIRYRNLNEVDCQVEIRF